MASSVIGALRVNLGMDTAQFEAGAEKAKKSAKGLQGALGGFASSFGSVVAGAAVGTAAIAAFTGGMRLAAESAQFADDLAASAAKLGVSAEYLQKFGYAAEASDVPIESAKDALAGLTSAIGALQTRVGDGKIRKAMEALGISQEQIKSFRSAEDALPVLADKISELGTVTEQLQLAKKFGIEALLPLLQQGSAGIEGLMNSAEQLGLVLDESVVNRLADMNERLRVADERAKMAGRGLGASLTPALVTAKEKMVELVKWLDRAIDGFNTLANRSKDTLSNQVEQSRGWVEFYESKGNQRAADKERARLSELQEALRNNERAAMRRKAADRANELPVTPMRDYPASTKTRARRVRDEDTQAELYYQAVSNRQRIEAEAEADALKRNTLKVDNTPAGFKSAEESLSDLRREIDYGAEYAREQFAYGFKSAFYALRDGGIKGLFESLADSFTDRLLDTLSDDLFDLIKGGGKGGGGGWLSSIASAASSFLGVGHNALGTPNWRGGPTWVGERGPELLNLPRGSEITPNHRLGGGDRIIRVQVDKTPYFDVAVNEAAQPMVQQYSVAAAEGGATLAENRMSTKRRTTLGSGRR